jgi:hypothetical protein
VAHLPCRRLLVSASLDSVAVVTGALPQPGGEESVDYGLLLGIAEVALDAAFAS